MAAAHRTNGSKGKKTGICPPQPVTSINFHPIIAVTGRNHENPPPIPILECHHADERLNLEHSKWADVIAVMEKRQLSRLKRQYGALINGKRLVCLDVPDQYEFMQPELVALLDEKLRRTLTKAAPRHAGSSD